MVNVKRTPEQKYKEMEARGRSPIQIRAVARAVDDAELLAYVQGILKEEEF